jgi:ABC-2 type transport system ATP-binding protein
MAVIKTVNLTKRYGTLVALSNLNLEIQAGDCFGFIGPNGAGKTTTIKILATLLQPTWGEARICDFVVGYQSRLIRPLIGYVPDYFGSYEDMVVQEYLEFFAAAYNIHGPQRAKVVSDVLELTDLGFKRDSLVDGLSRGMKQRLAIARVLVHDPRVLLLDEPAGNLDPRARIEMRELLKELRRMGKTILISSHILPELADLCNAIGIIERGELLYSGPVGEILRRARTGTVLQVAVDGNSQQAAALLSQHADVLNVAANNGQLQVSLRQGVSDWSFVPQQLVQAGFRLTLLKEEEVNLETAFMRLTKGQVQ